MSKTMNVSFGENVTALTVMPWWYLNFNENSGKVYRR